MIYRKSKRSNLDKNCKPTALMPSIPLTYKYLPKWGRWASETPAVVFLRLCNHMVYCYMYSLVDTADGNWKSVPTALKEYNPGCQGVRIQFGCILKISKKKNGKGFEALCKERCLEIFNLCQGWNPNGKIVLLSVIVKGTKMFTVSTCRHSLYFSSNFCSFNSSFLLKNIITH